VLVIYILAYGMSCEERPISRLDSPDKRRTVIVYRSECGVTVRDTTRISVHPIGRTLDSDRYPPFYVAEKIADLKVTWDGADHLAVTGASEQDVYRRNDSSGPVTIRYQIANGVTALKKPPQNSIFLETLPDAHAEAGG
jgi:hypothetical protein